MSLFDGAERRVETHKTGNNTRYNQFGKKIYNVPEKKEAVTAGRVRLEKTGDTPLTSGLRYYKINK